jgi:hypothetical protein
VSALIWRPVVGRLADTCGRRPLLCRRSADQRPRNVRHRVCGQPGAGYLGYRRPNSADQLECGPTSAWLFRIGGRHGSALRLWRTAGERRWLMPASTPLFVYGLVVVAGRLSRSSPRSSRPHSQVNVAPPPARQVYFLILLWGEGRCCLGWQRRPAVSRLPSGWLRQSPWRDLDGSWR